MYMDDIHPPTDWPEDIPTFRGGENYIINSMKWSPRWTINSGSPRMLLVLVREFESLRGENLNLFAKIKKKGSTAESAY